MKLFELLPILSLVLGGLTGPSALPMTDYSQLNHDEPTHWTKAATTGGTEAVGTNGRGTTTAGPWSENGTEIINNGTEPTEVDSITTNSKTVPIAMESSTADGSTPEATTTEKVYEEQFYRYDVDDMHNLFPGDDAADKREMSDDDMDKILSSYRKQNDKLQTDYKEGFDSEQDDEINRNDALLPTVDDNYDTPFKKWDRESEEQEKLLENIVFQANDTFDMEVERESSDSPSRWFLLLLAGNSTIVKLRQKDFAKYLKLNLAARLSLEYDEVKVNKVVLAPPRLMVNVSVVPSGMGNLDDEFDLNERLFGEEEAPLHKLAETNATLLELSGEEYHVVRFLSLRSQQPVSLDEASSETVIVTDRHTEVDIEKIIYTVVGGACLILLLTLVIALFRLYIISLKVKWPWKREKLFSTLPRHQRMSDSPPGPLVIYSGAFVDRNGPPSGSWIEENYSREEAKLENPLDTMIDPGILENPKFQVDSRLHILGCRPNHLLLPHTPVRHKNLDVRIPRGLDNPNYQT
ncbi:uncharacterized protein [Halyomorpha halys]|uniref:uncharacterized protein n=1 Tax=Halyomorpha halys TaxID=286706 RepID=UPI0006D50D47|nr:uncharacterized protein LOC106692020 isoform X2 [Halyomorpha halys]